MEKDRELFSYRRNREGEEGGAEIQAGMETKETAGPQGTLHQGRAAT